MSKNIDDFNHVPDLPLFNAVLITDLIVNKNTNTNLIVLIAFLYILPYLLYN